MCFTCSLTKECAEHLNLSYYGHIVETNTPKRTAKQIVHYAYSITGKPIHIFINIGNIEIKVFGELSCKDIRNNFVASIIFNKWYPTFVWRIDNVIYGPGAEKIDEIRTWVDENIPEYAKQTVLVFTPESIKIEVNGEVK